MKDKRQRMAFTWPYADPQLFAYMLSAVAATGYSQPPSNMPQPMNVPPQQQMMPQQVSAAAPHRQAPIIPVPNNINSKISINTDNMQCGSINPLQLNISTPSPKSPVTQSTPISNLISTTSALQKHVNGADPYDFGPFQAQNMISPNLSFPNSCFMPGGHHVSSQMYLKKANAVSFKSPAFGLANIDHSAMSHAQVQSNISSASYPTSCSSQSCLSSSSTSSISSNS